MDLMAAIQGGAPRAEKSSKEALDPFFLEAIGATFTGLNRMQLADRRGGADCSPGFFASRLTTTNPSAINAAGVAGDDVYATVRSVRPDSAGHVQITFDETRPPDDVRIDGEIRTSRSCSSPARLIRMLEFAVEAMGLLKNKFRFGRGSR